MKNFTTKALRTQSCSNKFLAFLFLMNNGQWTMDNFRHQSTKALNPTKFFLFCFTFHISYFIFPSFSQQDTAYIYTFGGVEDDICKEIQATADNGFILVGSTASFGNGATDIYLINTITQ